MSVDPRIQAALNAPLKGAASGKPFKAKGGVGRKSGYVAAPGTGPSGQSCRTCRHIVRKTPGKKTYLKCGLIDWSNGSATDIRAKSPACSRWEPQLG